MDNCIVARDVTLVKEATEVAEVSIVVVQPFKKRSALPRITFSRSGRPSGDSKSLIGSKGVRPICLTRQGR